MYIVELITKDKDLAMRLDNPEDWDMHVEVQFLKPMKTLDNPLTVHSLYLTHCFGREIGYWGTLPLRDVKGTLSYEKGETVRTSMNLMKELKRHDAVKFALLTPGAASIQIKGAIWLADEPPKEFTLKRNIILK